MSSHVQGLLRTSQVKAARLRICSGPKMEMESTHVEIPTSNSLVHGWKHGPNWVPRKTKSIAQRLVMPASPSRPRKR
ncbi:hypothetical protein FOPE_04165 [Fonsecaea pedrosoi]|nr:hypothetical protein FOPE_04165 [Fonsecaea pedrosoi]